MKVYISGKITGMPMDEVEKLFEKAEREMRKCFDDVLSPLWIPVNQNNPEWRHYMIEDIKVLVDCDAIYMISNWKESRGAILEHHIAKELGMNIIYGQEVLK